MNKNRLAWRVLVILVLAVTLISFLWIFTYSKTAPELFSIPYILWTSFLVTVFLVASTWVGSRVFPFKSDDQR